MQSKIVILGTGGTIAGTASSAADALGYTAAQISVSQLLAAVPPLADWPLECEQVAQLDSKDMDFLTWQQLADRCTQHLARADVAGVVVTHGTDTLEETAYFLHRVLDAQKPVVLTAAMRPATALSADGAQNLFDAVSVARHEAARGVTVVMAGTVHGASDVTKVHSFKLDAFSSGDAGPIAVIESGRLRAFRPWPSDDARTRSVWQVPVEGWPRVEIVTSHAGADGAIVDALVAAGVQGVVVAATGNGTVHRRLDEALSRAVAHGVRVAISSRCASGPVIAPPSMLCAGGDRLSPAKTRVALLLEMLAVA